MGVVIEIFIKYLVGRKGISVIDIVHYITATVIGLYSTVYSVC